jgi:hypothetical protein
MTERLDRGSWFGIATACILVGLFVWLRWSSGLWQYRWTGFCFGIAFVLGTSLMPGRARKRIDFARRYDIPDRVSLVGNIGSLALGAIILKSFFFGGSFFSSGSRAGSDDGFFGVVLLASAIDGAYLFWLSNREASRAGGQESNDNLNHGKH